jgi:hypothetical protein
MLGVRIGWAEWPVGASFGHLSSVSRSSVGITQTWESLKDGLEKMKDTSNGPQPLSWCCMPYFPCQSG